jgi:hypothetical protein
MVEKRARGKRNMNKRDVNTVVSNADDEWGSGPLTPDTDKADQNDEAFLAAIAKRSFQPAKTAGTERRRTDSLLREEQETKLLDQKNATSQELEETVEPPVIEKPQSVKALDFEGPREYTVKELPEPASQETAEPTPHVAKSIRSQPSADGTDTTVTLNDIPRQVDLISNIEIKRPSDGKSFRPRNPLWKSKPGKTITAGKNLRQF